MIHYGLLFLLTGTSAVGAATAVNASAGPQHPSSPSSLSDWCYGCTVVGDRCINLYLSVNGTWEEMRKFCQKMDLDLIVISDFQFYLDIIQYLKAIGTDEHFWIGASDLEKEGQWLWIYDMDVTMGTPYWANYGCDNEQMPNGGTAQNCLALDGGMHHYFNDFECEATAYPICEFFGGGGQRTEVVN